MAAINTEYKEPSYGNWRVPRTAGLAFIEDQTYRHALGQPIATIEDGYRPLVAAAAWRATLAALAILAAGPAGRQALELEALGRSKQLGAARERLDALEREIRRVSDFLAVPGWSRRG